MLTIVGLIVAAAGMLAFLFSWSRLLGTYLPGSSRIRPRLFALLIIIGTGLQVYEAWGKLPAQCRSWAGAASCMMPALLDAKGKWR